MGKAERPTEGELEILRIIWEHGPSTGTEIREALRPKAVAQSTVASILAVMLEKKQIASTNNMKPHRYRALLSRRTTFRRLIEDVGRQLFGARGRPNQFLSNANPEAKRSAKEIAALKKLLDEAGDP